VDGNILKQAFQNHEQSEVQNFSMVESCDAGSLPFVGNFQKFFEGASNYGRVVNDSTEFFEKRIVSGFLDKVEAGIDVPNYPQFRDMTQMFFDMIEGVEKISGGHIETATLTLKEGRGSIPEVSAIKSHSKEIYEKLGKPFQLRICVTGPYTMSSLFAYKDKGTFIRLGNVLAQIIEANVFNNKQGSVHLVSIDEPVFGFIDDPLLDRGSEGRENLLKAWESMMQKIRAKGIRACLHLHNTSDELFWEAKALNIIESHVNDSLYQAKRTKERLESTDKFLKASLAVTIFDELIRNNVVATSKQKLNETSINEKIAETWKSLTKKQIDPIIFVENAELMKERLVRIVERFGENRVPYAGPECGLRSFPTYKSALECLRRVSKVVKGN
jgi:5-methyltetrahydropteroyltriglutamate--homocysteine methyltransferase